MSGPVVSVLGVLLLLVIAAVVLLIVFGVSRGQSRDTTTALEVAEREDFIEHLREVAWQHRDVSPELATIILDEIAKRRRPPLEGPR
ncbi:MAG: hypothetical protein LT071_06025 [Nocardioides sp.]|nr:hypothetical protein [Nocardioides sp.]